MSSTTNPNQLAPPPPSSTPSIPPPASIPPSALVPEPELIAIWRSRINGFVEHMGDIGSLSLRALRATVKRPFETAELVRQMDSLGVRSLGIVAVTSVFIGMVMTIQFAYGLQRFGGIEYIPRVITLSFMRELGPTLTAIIVGGRIGSGMAAEVGAMNVTEQIDAIRALGGDPAKKLVLPRVAAAMIVMPFLSMFADALGIGGAALVCSAEYNIGPRLFTQSALQAILLSDLVTGLAKTPIFGYIIAIVGCHFGLTTRGGTEGVGQSTTRTVVVVSISILIADYFLTRIFVAFGPA
jgi:phospholipid/cholesterol/gamma-HCH transport system permease protein